MLRTGWSEGDLAATSPGTVAKMRWALYAEALKGAVGLDIDRELQDLRDAREDDPKRQKNLRRRRIYEAEQRLQSFRAIQASTRVALYLDDPEPIPPDAET